MRTDAEREQRRQYKIKRRMPQWRLYGLNQDRRIWFGLPKPQRRCAGTVRFAHLAHARGRAADLRLKKGARLFVRPCLACMAFHLTPDDGRPRDDDWLGAMCDVEYNGFCLLLNRG